MRHPRKLRSESLTLDGDELIVRELSAAEMQSYLLHLRRLGRGDGFQMQLLLLFCVYDSEGPWLCHQGDLQPPAPGQELFPLDAALEIFEPGSPNALPGGVYMKLIEVANRVNDSSQAPPKN
jgi:hypothetical protein